MTCQTQWTPSPIRHPDMDHAFSRWAAMEATKRMAHGAAAWETDDPGEASHPPSLSAWFGAAPEVGAPYKLLIPVIDSPASLSSIGIAIQMIRRVPDAELHLFNAQLIDRADTESLARFGMQDTEAIRDVLCRQRIPFRLTIASGFAGDSIRAYAEREGVAEIVMGSKLFNRLGQMFFGSVAFDIAENCRTPVTLVRQNDLLPGRTRDDIDWLIPCDGRPASLRAVRYLIGHLAASGRTPKIHLPNVQTQGHFPDERPLPRRGMSQRPDAQPRLSECQEQGLVQCRDAASLLEAARLPHDIHVMAGDPVSRILEASNRFRNAHVVMGARRRRLFGARGFGSVADRIVLEIRRPLTLVK